MNTREATARIRETLRGRGDARTSAWACAQQLDVDELRRIAAVWLLQAARNAERAEVREVERKHAAPTAPTPSAPRIAPDEHAAIERNVAEVFANKTADERKRIARQAVGVAAAYSTHVPRKGTSARQLWELVVPRGVEWAASEDRAAAEANERLLAITRQTLDVYAADLRVRWTHELLAQSFVVDGEVTTWGDATLSQHRRRAEQFSDAAVASLEGAGRHLRAIADLEAAGASTLAAMLVEVAA